MIICAVCMNSITCVAAQHFMASAHGEEILERSCELGCDAYVTLPLVAGLSASHILLSVQCCALLPSEVFVFLPFSGVSLTLGLSTRMTIYSASLLASVILLLSHEERRFRVAAEWISRSLQIAT